MIFRCAAAGALLAVMLTGCSVTTGAAPAGAEVTVTFAALLVAVPAELVATNV